MRDADTRSELEAVLERSTAGETLLGLAAESSEAADLLEQLARSVFPPEQRDVEHLTWPEVSQHVAVPKDPVHAAEERLRAAEARFKSLVEQIPAVTFLAALGEGENEVYVSPHIEAMLGFTQQEWLENPFLWYWQLHPDDRALWNEEFTRGCGRGGPFQAECRFLAKDGHVVWVHGEARILKDAQGRPQFLQGIAFDITESKRAQEILMDRAVQDARMAKELDIARRVQTEILPKVLDVPGLEMSAVMLTATEVGGDYYDVYPKTDGAWIAIGDVSGHGLQAGIVMLMAQTGLSALTLTLPDAAPSLVLSRLNQLLYDNIRTRLCHDDHVTFTLLRYQNGGQLRFAGAHEIFLVWRARSARVEAVATPGTWLGAVQDISDSLPESTLVLEPGDVFLLYTDGVTEAMNELGEQFGLERLTRVLADAAREPTATIVQRIVDAVRTFMVEQADDISIVVMRELGGKGSAT